MKGTACSNSESFTRGKKFPKDCQYVGFDFDLVKTTYSTLVSIEHVTKTKGKYLERIFQFLRQSFNVICLGSMKISVSKSLCYVRRDESPT